MKTRSARWSEGYRQTAVRPSSPSFLHISPLSPLPHHTNLPSLTLPGFLLPLLPSPSPTLPDPPFPSSNTMLSVEPAFLPLQPLSNTITPVYCPSRSSTPLPQSCSISSIRASFHPFPLRRIPTSDAWTEVRDVPSRRQRKPVVEQDIVTIRSLRSNDVERVKRLHVSLSIALTSLNSN